MNFNAKVASLEYVALVRTVAALWNQRDIRRVLKGEFYPWLQKQKEIVTSLLYYGKTVDSVLRCLEIDRIWRELEQRVTDNVLQLRQIPNSIKKKLESIVKPVGKEIRRWILFQDYLFDVHLPAKLCWSPEGIVDELETARMLVDDEENLDVMQRYKIACVYCFQNKLWDLWKRIPRRERQNFYVEEDPEGVEQHELVKYWSYTMEGEMDKWERAVLWRLELQYSGPHMCALQCAAISRNKAAMDYFLQKLNPQEKQLALVECVRQVLWTPSVRPLDLPTDNQPHILEFLFSQMDERQLQAALGRDDGFVMSCFLEWPWQDSFMRVAEFARGILDEFSILKTLFYIVRKIGKGHEYHDYKNLFIEFWQRKAVKKGVFVLDDCNLLLNQLFRIRDKELIKLLLDDVPAEHKRNVIFSNRGKSICKYLIHFVGGDMLKFFLTECLPDMDSLVKFKFQFEKHSDINENSKQTVKRIIDELLGKEEN